MKTLAQALAACLVQSAPKLRDAIRDALDKGASPAEIRRRWGDRSALADRAQFTSATVEYIIEEWERDRGR